MNILNRINQRQTNQNKPGFTLVELMVVVAVIIILVSITVIGYGAWRTQSAESAVKSDLNSLASGMESYRNWNDGYPALTAGTVFDGDAATRDIFRPGGNTTVTYISGDKSNYCVEGVSQTVPEVVFHASAVDNSRSVEPGDC